MNNANSESRTRQLHADALVIDGHCDSIGDQLERGRWLGERSPTGHIDLPRLREGGVDAQFFACFVPVAHQRHGAVTHAMARLDQLLLLAEREADRFVIALTADDIPAAKAAGKVAGILGLEGAEALDGEISLLRQYYRLGIRNLGLAWNFRNAACDGVSESRTNGGLTEFGVRVVEECNRLGMMLDLSHLSPAGVTDVLALSRMPVIASHSNARTLWDHPRNLTDDQLRAVAAGGGVVGVTFVDAFLAIPGTATLNHVIDQIDYLLDLIGPDHVAIGSDFDGCMPPEELADVTRYPSITERLVARGHAETVIRKVLGENYLRVFRTVCG